MKRHGLLILFNIMFLIILLYIQVNWIIRVAEKEEAIFSQKVRMALTQTINDIKNDTSMCYQMECSIQNNLCRDGYFNLNKEEKSRFNCLIKKNLRNLDINLNYDFDIVSNSSNVNEVLGNNNYTQSLENALNKAGIHIRINFPDKSEFIISQIGFMFITSVVLIILITTSFIITIVNYRKEKRLDESTKDFINNMVHEFKTPLANILLANNLVRKNIENKNKITKYTSIIKAENSKLERQVERLLQVSILEKNNKYKLSEINLNDIVCDAVKSFQFIVNENGGKINVNLKATQPIVKGESGGLTNAISNVIDNAIKYSVDFPDILIETYNISKQVVVKISDNGIGIAKKHIPVIFDKYYRVSTGDIHNVKGFGIGLAYVKNVIESYNGKIVVESKIGKGSIFYIFLPNYYN